MKSTAIAVFWLCSILARSEATSDSPIGVNATFLQSLSPRVVGVGNYGGKLYFADTEFAQWSSANNICLDNNLHLVNIESASELSYLVGAMKAADMGAWFWTSARDTKVFKWDGGNGAQVGLALGNYRSANENCLIMGTGYPTRIYIASCTETTVAKALCQIRAT